jgi:hypothetical protein
MRRSILPFAVQLTLATAAAPLIAQTPACTYDQCALRVAYSPAGSAVVRGAEEVVVDGLGFWAGDMASVFVGSSLSQDLADGYRLRHNAGTVLTGVGTILFFASLIASDGNLSIGLGDGSTLAWLGGVALIAIGTRVSVSGDDHLSRAIWEYNRTLPH